MHLQILLILAVLPAVVIFFLVIKNARSRRKSFGKIAKVFGLSALSTLPAILLELLGQLILYMMLIYIGGFSETGSVYIFIECLFVIGISEECCKYLTFKWMIFDDRSFDNTYDGVIYGAASALGFATLENIMYIFGSEQSLQVALIRAVISVPMHAATGIYMGYCFGISKYKKYNNITYKQNPQRLAYLIAVLLHGMFDFAVMVGNTDEVSEAWAIPQLIAVGIICILAYVIIGRTIYKAKRENTSIYNEYYYNQLNGAYQDTRGHTTTKNPFPVYQYYNQYPGGYNNYWQNGQYIGYNNYWYNNQNGYGQNYNQNYAGNPYYGSGQNYGQNYGYNNYNNYVYPNNTYTPNQQQTYQYASRQNNLGGRIYAPTQTQVKAINICPNCSKEYTQGSRFCSYCGKKL